MSTSSTPSPSLTAAGVPRAGGAGTLGDRTVSRIGYGVMQLERLRDDPDAAVALLRRALDLGVDHVDTAEFYGDGFCNRMIREAYRAEDDVVVVSKVGADPNPGGERSLRPAQRPEQLRASVEDNLRSLGLDRVPVVNLRRLDTRPGLQAEGDQIVDIDDQLAVMTALRDEGKIGAIGLSGVLPENLRRALPAGIVCVQNSYNVISREFEDMLRLCEREGIAWMPFFPLGSAFPAWPKVTEAPAVAEAARALGHSPAQIGLAWLLHHAPNILLIPGTADAGHLAANVAAGAVVLDADTLAALDALDAAHS